MRETIMKEAIMIEVIRKRENCIVGISSIAPLHLIPAFQNNWLS
jgi:hypothetical protein